MRALFPLFMFALTATAAAPFREFPVGDEITTNSLTIAAVYLPSVTIDMAGHDHGMDKFAEPGKEKLHFEADIHATKGNPNGFAAGDWIPYLSVTYKLTQLDSGKSLDGNFEPMVARDGPHYGATVRMLGKGKYRLRYSVSPPSPKQFGRHTDVITGVAPWWRPFEVEWEFEYNGLPQ
jgi:uncharacterized protein involved in high-affinity Fe2+ transport